MEAEIQNHIHLFCDTFFFLNHKKMPTNVNCFQIYNISNINQLIILQAEVLIYFTMYNNHIFYNQNCKRLYSQNKKWSRKSR